MALKSKPENFAVRLLLARGPRGRAATAEHVGRRVGWRSRPAVMPAEAAYSADLGGSSKYTSENLVD